jgi:hypothetical protein
MTGNRFFWIADLLDGYDSVFTTPHNQTLVVSDTQGLHPTMVLHAASTAGTVVWGGAERYTAPLVNGENKPTLYVHSTDEMDITITITAGIIDHDPCSGQAALALANTSATVYGTAWPTFTSCLGSPQWDPIEAGSNPQSLSLELDPRVPELEPHQTRELTITGLPAGVTWTPESLTPPLLSIELTADASVPPGDYPLVFDVVTRSEINSVVSYSHALNTTGSLTITPAPAPEPEPEPESELGVEEDIEESIESVVPVLIGESSSSGSRVLLNEPSVVVEPVVTSRALTPPQPIEEITGAFVVPATPAERELFTPRERVPSYSPVIPEPSAASAWLGVSLAIAAALAGIFALLLRRSEEQED